MAMMWVGLVSLLWLIANVFAGKYFSIDEHIEGDVDPIQGIEGLLRMPRGSGEHSMLRFGPNCAVVWFLAATNPGSEKGHLPLLKQGF